MKQSKRILALVLSVLLTLTLLPLSAGAAVKIAPPKQTQYVDIGGKAQLALTVSGGKKASSLPLTYASENPAVATVNKKGLITGVAKGIANITVTYDTQTLKVPVYVCEAFKPYTDKETYKISAPKSWKYSGRLLSIFFIFIAQPEPFAVIMNSSNLDQDYEVAEYASQLIDQRKMGYTNFQLISSEKTTFAGRDGWKLLYTYTNDQGGSIMQQEIFTVHDGVCYELYFGGNAPAFEQYSIELKRMLDSFKLLV